MHLKQYIKKVGGVQTFYRIYDYYAQCAVPQIKLKTGRAGLAKEIQDAVFRGAPKGVFVFISDLANYIYYDKEPKIASIVTIATDRWRGKEEFKAELKKSAEIRRDYLNYVQATLKPFLKNLIKSPLVAGIILRGDIMDPKRFPSKASDIDIVILTNFKSDDAEKREQIIKLIKKSPCNVVLDYYKFNDGSFHSSGVPITNRKSNYKVEYAIISLPSVARAYIIWKKSGKKIKKYDAENFLCAKILFDKNNSAKKFLKMLLSLAPKGSIA